MDEIAVSRLMSSRVECVSRGTTLAEAATLMHEHSRSCLVVTEGDAPVGIITERDMVGTLAEMLLGQSPGRMVGARMTSPVLTVREDAGLFEALVLCQSRHIRHLPVVDADGRLAGILTQSDLVRAHLEMIETQREQIERAVAARTSELTEINERLKALAMEDSLLSIGNRRAMEVDLQYTHEAALRYGHVYSLALFDVDSFKKYNDTYGHAAGDDVLRAVGRTMRKGIRRSDRLYRYGGEEILLVLPMTSEEGAEQVCLRLMRALEDCGIEHTGSLHDVITMSCGVATVHHASSYAEGWRAVAELADKSLYRAKALGRNAIVVHRPAERSAVAA
jgi:diguanylate cyclase (GGDEF)-like protein